MPTVTLILFVAALVFCLLSASGKAQLWIAVLLVILAGLLQLLPR